MCDNDNKKICYVYINKQDINADQHILEKAKRIVAIHVKPLNIYEVLAFSMTQLCSWNFWLLMA